jgi:hypothetical protein
LFAPLHIFQTSTTLRIWINSWKDSILLDKRLYSKSSLALTLEWHSCEVHSRGLKCEYEWSLSDMLYSLRKHSSSTNVV